LSFVDFARDAQLIHARYPAIAQSSASIGGNPVFPTGIEFVSAHEGGKYMQARQALLCALAAAACALPAVGQAESTVIVTPADPAYQPAPVVREGYTWVPGYWTYDGNSRVWVSGHYERNNTYVLREPDVRYYPNKEEEHHWWRRHHDDD
jgi:hypothetical protein